MERSSRRESAPPPPDDVHPITVLICEQKKVSSLLLLIHDMLSKRDDMVVYDHCVLADLPHLTEQLEPDVALFVTGYPRGNDEELVRQHRSEFAHTKLIAISLGASVPGYTEPLYAAGVHRVVPAEDALQLARHIREVVGERNESG